MVFSFKRTVLPLLAVFLLSACAEGQHWGEWFPEETKDPDEEFFCQYYGNCPKPRSEKCDFWGRCGADEKDQSVWGRGQTPPQNNVWGSTQSCDFYGNCKSSQ